MQIIHAIRLRPRDDARGFEVSALMRAARRDGVDFPVGSAGQQDLRRFVDRRRDAPFDHVYGTEHASIAEQRRDFLANLEREADHG